MGYLFSLLKVFQIFSKSKPGSFRNGTRSSQNMKEINACVLTSSFGAQKQNYFLLLCTHDRIGAEEKIKWNFPA